MPAALERIVEPDTDAANSNTSRVRTIGTETALGLARARPRVAVDIIEAPENRQPAEIDLEQLYPASAELNTKLSQALMLLSQSLQRMTRAIEYIRSGDLVLADDQTHHLLTLLDELFCLRDLAEGFANVVNACTNAVRNLHGQMAEERHLLAINSCLLALKKKPLLSFDASLELVERLEAVDLDVDTRGIDEVVNWLSDESPN